MELACRLGRLADDPLARAIGVGGGGVGDDVDVIEEGGVEAVAAGDPVDLVVAGVEGVVARPTVERVADPVDLAIGARMDVAASECPQVVIARAAVGAVSSRREPRPTLVRSHQTRGPA